MIELCRARPSIGGRCRLLVPIVHVGRRRRWLMILRSGRISVLGSSAMVRRSTTAFTAVVEATATSFTALYTTADTADEAADDTEKNQRSDDDTNDRRPSKKKN